MSTALKSSTLSTASFSAAARGASSAADAERQAAATVIDTLDITGYLPMPLEELVDPDGPQDQLPQLQKALLVVQGMDPPGVGARDLRECLLLQIRHDMPHARQMRRLVA